MAKVIGQTADGKVLTLTVTRAELYDLFIGGTNAANEMLRLEPGDAVDLQTGAITKSPLRQIDGAEWEGSNE